MRRKNFLLLSVIIFLMLIIFGFFFLRTPFLLNRIKVALESQLEKQLKHELNISAISGNILRGLKLKNVVVESNPRGCSERATDKPVITADEIYINYKLWGLIRGKFLITDLHFKKPELNAYISQDGVLNLQKLVPKKKKFTRSDLMFNFLVSRFTVEEGKFNFADARHNINFSATGINMDVEGPLSYWNHSGNFAFVNGEVEWNSAKSKIDKFSTDFYISKDEGKLKLKLNMGDSWLIADTQAMIKSIKEDSDSPFLETRIRSEIELKDFQKFLFADKKIEGRVHINADASSTLSDISGKLALSSPDVRLNELRLDRLRAQAEFTENSFTVSSFHGNLADGKIKGSFSVNQTDNALSYDSDIKLTRLNTTKLLPMLAKTESDESSVTFPKIEGFLNGTLKIKNNQANLETVSSFGDFELVDSTINDVKIAHSKAHYEIKNSKISLSANLDKARINIDGEVGFSSPLALNLKINKVDTGKLAEILDAPEFSGTGSLTGTITKAQEQLLTHQSPLTSHHSPITNWSGLLLQANFEVPDAAFYNVPIGMVNGHFNYIDRKLSFERITVEQGQTQCSISGSAFLWDQIPVQLKAKFEPLEISRYRKLLGGKDYPISGLMNGSISIHGDLDKLDGGGNIRITEGKAWELDLDPFILPVKLDSSTVYIPSLVVSSKEQKAFFSAKIRPNGDYEFGLLTELYPSELLQRSALATSSSSLLATKLGDSFSSKLNCKATGIGNLSSPEFDINLELTDIYYANQPIGKLHISGEYLNDTLFFEGSALNETCEIDGKFAWSSRAGSASMRYELNLRGKSVELTPFLAMIDPNLPKRIDGEVDGTVHIAGKLKEPDTLKIKLTLPHLALHEGSNDIVNRNLIDLEFSEKAVHINSFELVDSSSKRSLIKISGDMELIRKVKGPGLIKTRLKSGSNAPRITFSDFIVSSDGFDLELANRILGLKLPVSGVPNFKLNLAGPADSPVFTLDYQIPNLVLQPSLNQKEHRDETSAFIKPIEIDDFSGKLVYQDNLLKVDCRGKPFKSEKAKDRNEIQMTGKIPIDLALVHKSTNERILDELIDLEILARFSASLLDYFIPDIEESSGLLELTAEVKNTTKSPQITGAIDFNDINLASKVMPQSIKNGKGNAVFSISIPTEGQNRREARRQNGKEARRQNGKEARGQKATKSGNPESREVSARFQSGIVQSEAKLENQKITNLPWSSLQESPIRFSVLLNEAKFQMGKGNYSARGEFFTGIAGPRFALNFSGENIELEPLLSHLTNQKFAFDGSCDASLSLSGSGGKPSQIKALLQSNRFEISPVSSDSYVIQNSKPIRIELRDNLLRFESFHLQKVDRIETVSYDSFFSSETVSISGRISPFAHLPSSLIDLNISTNKIDLTEWTALLNLPYHPSGELSLAVDIGGLLESPIIEASWILDSPIFSESSFTNRITGSITYDDKLLTLNKTQIYLYESIIRAEGNVPIDLAFTKKSVERRDISTWYVLLDEPMNLTLSGDNVNLAFLSSFNRRLTETKGVAEINLAIKGTSAQPHYEGTLRIFDLFAKLSEFDKPIRNGRLEIEAIKGVILLEHLSCQMGLTSLLANGNIKMDGIIPKVLNIAELKLQNAQINDFAPLFLNEKFVRRVSGQITASANMKVNLPTSRLFAQLKGEDILKNVSSFIKFKDVLIEWKDENSSAVQYRVSNSQEIEVTLRNQRLYFDFVLEDHTARKLPLAIAVKGDFKLNERLVFNMDITNFDVSPISNWINLPYDLEGRLNSQLRVRGSSLSPVIRFNWSGEELSITRANIDKFTGNLTYSNQSLQISGQTTIGQNYTQFSAEIPISISLQRHKRDAATPIFEAKPLNSESEAQLDMKINDLEFVPLIDNQLSFMEGNGEVNLTVGGQISNPSISGLARFNNISFYLPAPGVEVKDTELFAVIDKNGIKFNRVYGKLNGGLYRVTGKIGFPFPAGLKFSKPKKLDLKVVWDNSVFRKSSLYWNWDLVKCDGNLTISGDTDIPALEGNVIIDEAKYEQSLEELVRYWTSKDVDIQTEAEYDYPLLRNMVLNVELQAPNNLWLTTGPVTVEANAYGRIVGEIEKPVFEGRMDILQGEFWYLDHKFIINEGYLSNKDPYRFNPKYFVSAEIDEPLENIELVDTEGQFHTRDVKIYVKFSGKLEEHNPPDFVAEVLHKEFGERYELDRQQIMSILAVGSINMFDTDSAFLMTDATPTILRKQAQLYVGNRLAKLIGFRALRFNLMPYSLQQSRFLVIKELSPRWAITYSSTLQIYEEPYIELEYQLNKHMAIKGERNEEGKYGVDLKLEYEFK